MMKLQAALSAGLAVVLVAPGRLVDERALQRLELALGETVRALEVLAGLEGRQAGQLAPDLLQAVTESPILDPRGRDERLQTLRNDVGLLQMELDSLESTEPPAEAAAGPAGAAPAPEGLAGVTSGLDDALLRFLEDLRRAPSPAAEPATVAVPVPATSPEREDYSADPVLEARACLFAGRLERGLSLLEPLAADPRALYWKARLLEKLDRLDEAIAALEKAAGLAGEGREAERIKGDLEFLEWKRGFLRRMKTPAGGAP